MRIHKLHVLTSSQIDDFHALMNESNQSIYVTTEILEQANKTPEIHFLLLQDESAASNHYG